MSLVENVRTNFHKYFNKIKGSGLKAKATRGGIWLGIGSGTENGFRFLRNMILARILVPDDFGLMAIIMAVNQLFESFTRMGIQEAVIQNPRGNDKVFLNGVFFLNFIRGLFLFGIAFISAPWVARFYEKPELLPMMRFAFLALLFNAILSPKLYSQLKKMNYRKWSIAYYGGSIIGVISTIVLCFIIKNVWAMVIGFVIENIARMIFSYIFCPFLPRLIFDKEAVHSLLQFVKGMFGLPILYYFFNKMDILVIGKLCPDSEVGIYNLVQSLAFIPFVLFSEIVGKLFMPIFSSLQNNLTTLRKKYLMILKYISNFSFPLLTLSACFASPILTIIYGKSYATADKIYMCFCACIALRVSGHISASLIFSLGKPAVYRSAMVIRFVIMLLLIIPSVYLMGPIGAVITSLFSLLIWIIIVFHNINKYIGTNISQHFFSLINGIIYSIFIVVIYSILRYIFSLTFSGT